MTGASHRVSGGSPEASIRFSFMDGNYELKAALRGPRRGNVSTLRGLGSEEPAGRPLRSRVFADYFTEVGFGGMTIP